MPDDRMLLPGRTCWRLEHADRFAAIIDAADYFHHCKAAMLRAAHSANIAPGLTQRLDRQFKSDLNLVAGD